MDRKGNSADKDYQSLLRLIDEQKEGLAYRHPQLVFVGNSWVTFHYENFADKLFSDGFEKYNVENYILSYRLKERKFDKKEREKSTAEIAYALSTNVENIYTGINLVYVKNKNADILSEFKIFFHDKIEEYELDGIDLKFKNDAELRFDNNLNISFARDYEGRELEEAEKIAGKVLNMFVKEFKKREKEIEKNSKKGGNNYD